MVNNSDEASVPSNVVSLPDDIKPEDFPELLEQTLVSFNDGDVIEGTIVRAVSYTHLTLPTRLRV